MDWVFCYIPWEQLHFYLLAFARKAIRFKIAETPFFPLLLHDFVVKIGISDFESLPN